MLASDGRLFKVPAMDHPAGAKRCATGRPAHERAEKEGVCLGLTCATDEDKKLETRSCCMSFSPHREGGLTHCVFFGLMA